MASLRVVTWNGGSGRARDRLSSVRIFNPDLAVLQGVSSPRDLGTVQIVWSGTPGGLGQGVIACNPGLRVDALPGASESPAVLAARVSGETELTVLAVWAPMLDSSGSDSLRLALEPHRKLLAAPSTLVAGSFAVQVEGQTVRNSREQGQFVNWLRAEFGLVSAYHAHQRAEHGRERHATHYVDGDRFRPRHVDLCFVPETWLPRVKHVEVGTYAEWQAESAHRPVLVELE